MILSLRFAFRWRGREKFGLAGTEVRGLLAEARSGGYKYRHKRNGRGAYLRNVISRPGSEVFAEQMIWTSGLAGRDRVGSEPHSEKHVPTHFALHFALLWSALLFGFI